MDPHPLSNPYSHRSPLVENVKMNPNIVPEKRYGIILVCVLLIAHFFAVSGKVGIP